MKPWMYYLASAGLGLTMIGGAATAVTAQTGRPAPASLARAQDTSTDCDHEPVLAPGTLDRGSDLLPQATLTLDQAIAAAQKAATGTLGEVDLEMIDGTLTFTVAVGDQDVRIDAKTGSVIEVLPGENGDDQSESESQDDQDVAPGTIDRGADLLPLAKVALDQAIATAQTGATGTLGEVDLEVINGALVFTVGIGDQDVRIDATTGTIVEVVSGELDPADETDGTANAGDNENDDAENEDSNSNDEHGGNGDAQDAQDDGESNGDDAKGDNEEGNDATGDDAQGIDSNGDDVNDAPVCVATPAA